jgi:hypothetical protein
MKTSSLPSIRIAPALRAALESVLAEGESLSSFVEASVRRAVDYRRVQAEFHARGQASWEEFQRTGVSHTADDVAKRIKGMIDAKRTEILGE